MKTEIISQEILYNANSLLGLKVTGLSNVTSLTVITSQNDVSTFNNDNYMEDPGWMDGSSYISCRYSYGYSTDINKLKQDIIDYGCSIDISEDDCLELFIFVFDAGNGKSLLVSNIDEHLMYNDTDFEDIEFIEKEQNIIHMIGGQITDDNDISINISACLISHPLTKGFKVPGNETYEFLTDELHTWDEYCEYDGFNVFGESNLNELKKGGVYFDLFKAANRLVLLNDELFSDRNNEINLIDFIMNNYEFCKNIPNSVRLEYKHGSSNKFYNVSIDPTHPGFKVDIEYGSISKTLTTDEQTFNNIEDAKKFYMKKVISKIKSGYAGVI